MTRVAADGALHGDEEYLSRLAAEGIRTVADVLARAETIRELSDRSNHVLRAAGAVVHVKRRRGRRRSPEAAAIRLARDAGAPVARLAFEGVDRRTGSIAGTFDLAPAKAARDLVREGALAGHALVETLAAAVRAAAALHRKGYCHHDLYLDHVFVDPARPSIVTVIDLERLTVGHGLLAASVVKDLASLESSVPNDALSCRRRARMVDLYLEARGFPVRRLRGPLARRVAKKATRIRRHVPRTPVGDAARPG